MDEKLLLSRVTSGDHEAFRCIFDRHRNKVYSYALKLTRAEILAEEVVQDVFMKIWINRANMAGIENLEAYLCRMTRNHVFNILKKMALETYHSLELGKSSSETISNTEETIIGNDFQRILDQAVDKLSPKQNVVYKLCHKEGLKYEEAASRLKISRLTVKTHMQQALRSIRVYFISNSDVLILILLSSLR